MNHGSRSPGLEINQSINLEHNASRAVILAECTILIPPSDFDQCYQQDSKDYWSIDTTSGWK